MDNLIEVEARPQLKIIETKQKMKELEDYLAKQYVEQEELQERRKQQKIRSEIAKNQRKGRFSSFANSLHRPEYITALRQSDLFNNQSGYVNKDVPFISNLQKSQLIQPDRNSNPQPILHQLLRPLNKQQSEFPPIRKRVLSQKEMKRIEFWDKNYSQLYQQELKEKSSHLIGKIKKQILEQKERLIFKPANQVLRYFDDNPSLISNYPISQRAVSKDFSLPKITKVQKVWMPNNNYF